MAKLSGLRPGGDPAPVVRLLIPALGNEIPAQHV